MLQFKGMSPSNSDNKFPSGEVSKIKVKITSNYLLVSNRRRCRELLKRKNDWKERDVAEFLIALHLVMEIGLNSFYRQIFTKEGSLGRLDLGESEESADELHFLDKTRTFLVWGRFNWQTDKDKEDAVKKHRRLKKNLIEFSAPRNRLLHGQEVSVSAYYGGQPVASKAKKLLTVKKAEEQISKFQQIIEDLNFFLDRRESVLNEQQLKKLRYRFLNTGFLSSAN